MRRRFERISFPSVGLALGIMVVSACSKGPTGDVGGPVDTQGSREGLREGSREGLSAFCLELLDAVAVGASRDAIPALTDPDMVAADDVLAGYMLPTDRVIGIKVGSDYLAFPHNILWWHEIVNVRVLGLAITYCPLTGSSMVFSNTAAGGAQLGVSGLLFQNNLVMYDRSASGVEESLWPQMLTVARCDTGSEQRNRVR